MSTIAIGSLVASTSVSRDPSDVQAMAALLTLLVLQVCVAAARRRFPTIARLLEFDPRVVVRDGNVDLDKSLLGAHLTWHGLRPGCASMGCST